MLHPSRRELLQNVSRLAIGATALRATARMGAQGSRGVHFSVEEFDHVRILKTARAAMAQPPVTLSQVVAPGKRNPQQFYSEKPSDNRDEVPFTGHADLLFAMNGGLSAMTAAWRLTGDATYFQGAVAQLQAWFVAPATRMLPTLDTVGIVPGVDDDRNSGLSATTALAESARAASFLCASPSLPESQSAAVRDWFASVLQWLTESRKGSIARQSKSLEAVCWTMQAAEFARFTRNETHFRECTHLFRDGLLRLMTFDGNFAPALRDRNPYATSMYTLECMGAACESLSTPFESLWNATLPDGRGMHSAVAWALPFLRDRAKWPYVSDREHFKDQPLRESALLFAGRAYDLMDYVETWKAMPADSTVAAVVRQHPVTQPALWTTRPPA